MPAWFYPLSIVIPFGSAIILCAVVIVTGMLLLSHGRDQKSREEVSADLPKWSIKFALSASTGVVLILAGLGVMSYIFFLYPKLLLMMPVLLGGAAASQQSRGKLKTSLSRRRSLPAKRPKAGKRPSRRK